MRPDGDFPDCCCPIFAPTLRSAAGAVGSPRSEIAVVSPNRKSRRNENRRRTFLLATLELKLKQKLGYVERKRKKKP